MNKDDLKIKNIKDGTVIDHLPTSTALKVFDILGLGNHNSTITIAINVPSNRIGKKDILKIEDKELSKEETDKIALVASTATINIIKNSEVVKKNKVEIPEKIVNIMKCGNPNCISNHEPTNSIFYLVNKESTMFRCHYCERINGVNSESLMHKY